MPLHIVRNDITRMQVDAVVNAANQDLLQGGGVCGAIFAAAGAPELQAACDAIGHCNTGDSVATPAFKLSAKHIIHTAGPVWQGGTHGEEQALRSCYHTALTLAHELGDTSIAFPLVSSGIYGYPKEAAIDVALGEIRAFLDVYDMDVFLTIFDAESLRASRGRFSNVVEYINDQYVRQSPYTRREPRENVVAHRTSTTTAPQDASISHAAPSLVTQPTVAPPSKPLHDKRSFLKRLLNNVDASFSTTLLRMIDDRGLKDSDVYKRANMSRQHFSKIRGNKGYQPKKHTVLALAIALELSLDETRLLLERAGFALTHASKRDIIVEFFIQQGKYDIYEINLALYAFDQPLLG